MEMAIIFSFAHPLIFPCSMDGNKSPHNHRSDLASLKGRSHINPRLSKLAVFASGGGTNGNGEIKEEVEAGGAGRELNRSRRPSFNLPWRDLLYPDPENILAVGLTGLLTMASIQILWQLFFISFTIVLAALKYSFIAALLLFILITLL